MRFSFSFLILSLCFLAFVVMAIVGDIPYWAWFIPTGIGIMSTLTVFRGTYLPQSAVTRGMELIQSQDYNNRLVKVGEPSADRIVELFNSLIDKLRAERLLNREQEGLLTLLIEASPMGVVMLDFDNRISMVNKSFLKIFGVMKAEEIEGKKINELHYDLIDRAITVPLGKSEIIRENSFKIYRVYHLNFLQEGFKREFYLLESLTDEIMKAEKASYEKVIRTISHEINNTMGGVRSVLEVIGDSSEDPEIKKVVESCDRRCENMGNFIREYAEVVKLPSPVKKSIDLQQEIQAMLPFLQHLVPENVSLIFRQKPSSFKIDGDSALLQQVLLNIVKNAIESIEGTGFIEIEVFEDNHNIVLQISNNGLPIDNDIANHLFTPFFTTKPEGKGIGLTLVRDVLTNHSADYSLSTDSDGITRFTITFRN
ncbi:MAG: GHKL domain-containing protein [Muribaculaceae bacterium]|nr:GHKL domain-containing protein [Muribaculaceae bacterium]